MNRFISGKKSNIFHVGFASTSLFQKLSFVIIALFLSAFSGDNPDIEKAKLDVTNTFREKVYLHIDKSYYTAGGDLWFKVYLVDGNTHRTLAQSKIVYVDLIDPDWNILVSKTIKINDGCGNGDFKLPENLIRGKYTIRAYTNYMRNFDEASFFRKQIIVNFSSDDRIANQDATTRNFIELRDDTARIFKKPDVQFFPEGGYLINGFVNQIAFKAMGPDGKGIDISGDIVDASGEQLSKFKTLKFGMGKLNFVPQKDQSYKANIAYKGIVYSYNLPTSLDSGVVMQIIEKDDFYSVIISSSLSNGVKDFELIGRQRNRLVSSHRIAGAVEGTKISIPKKVLEDGIAQFTLFDNNGAPLCERLVFVETNNSEPIVNISPSKNVYGKRELVELEISVDQSILQNPDANMSISVADISASGNDYDNLDIKSYLLLNSELRGVIEHPGYYFYSDDPDRKKVLDLLMMTQGWRQFVLNDPLNNNSSNLKFASETGIRFEGCVKRFNEEGKPVRAEVSLIYSNNQEEVYNETNTDDQGHFIFDGLDFADSTSVIIQAKNWSRSEKEDIKNPNTNFYIVMDSLSAPKITHHKTSKNSSDEISDKTFPKDANPGGEIDNTFQTQKGDILIEEVIVTEKMIDRFKEKRSMYFEPSNHLDFKTIQNFVSGLNVFAALDGRIPGVNVDGDNITIRGRSSVSKELTEPLFLLDGMPVGKGAILSVPISQVDFVDVLKGPKTTIYGPSGANGVIAVYTLNAGDILSKTKEKETKCILNFIHPGYSKARKFYEPIYTSGNQNPETPDYRSTIYWNPMVKFDEKGKLKISFYSADTSTSYKIELEGITSDGVPIKSESLFEVK